MKTKRLFLKLLLAVCFLMAVPPREAEAAQSMNISDGDILINNNKLKQGEDLGETIDTDDPDAEALSANAYTISGSASKNRKITISGPINVAGKNAVYLTFNGIDAFKDIVLNITNATVYITVQGTNNSLMSSSGNAITLKDNANLHFSGTNSRIEITGASTATDATAAVNADLSSSFIVDSGRVVLIAGNGNNTANVPFNGGGMLTINNGTLECYKNNDYTEYGTGSLNQVGGIVKSDGLANIDMANEKIVGLKHDNYSFFLQSDDGGDYKLGEISNPSAGIKINEDWLGKYFVIRPSDSTSTNSVRQTLYIPKRKSPSPSGLTAKPESTSGADDGTISRVDATMQYAIDKGANKENYNSSDWKTPKLEGNTLVGLEPGTYRLRYKYIDSDNPTDRVFASVPSQPVTVERGGTLKASLSHSFGTRDYKYTEAQLPTPASISIENLDKKGSVHITSITSDTEAFNVIDGTNEITQESTDTSWTIQPALGLDAGEYKASITINYENRLGDAQDAITLTDAVQFTVKRLPYEGDRLEVAPELDSASFNSITLKPIVIEGNPKEFEYSKDGGKTWQKELTFTDLEADTAYKFVARYASTTNYEASDPGPTSKDIKTEKKASILYSTKELSLMPNRKYRISIEGNDEIFDECTADKNASDGTKSLMDIKDKWFGKTIVIYDTVKDNTQTLNIPDIGKAPTSPKGQAESFSSAGDGKILGVTTSMEYKLKGSNDDWITCPAKTIENLAAGTYLVRTKAVDEGSGENKKYTFASQATEVVVGRGNALSITPETFDLGKSPYKVLPTAKAIAFRNHDKTEDITIKSIALSDDSPFAILHKETDSVIVPAGKNNETFKIQPKPDLNVGTYTDEFVVTFEVGYNPDTDTSTGDGQIQAQSEGFNTDSPDTSGEKSAAIPITFTVEKGTQEAPPVPAEKSVKSTSITLETIPNSTVSGAKAQYSKDSGKTWQDSPTFNKLKADTEYYFVSRYAATDNYNESEISAGENAITTAEKDDDDDNDNSNKNVSSNANGSNGTNGTSGTNGTNGTNGTTGTNTTGTNGTNGTNNTNGTTSRGVSAARTGDLNNIQLWVTLMIGSYLSCYLIIRDRIKKARIK